ncbi:MAG: XdhC family protein [Cyclobacteriaceae bacterium]
MQEIKAILEMYHASESRGMKKALATVVHVRGSSYRRPGARMLVLEDGSITGAISGGCLENDALRKARLAMATDAPRLVVYDTSNEEDASIGVQLGCNGVITVLFESLSDEKDPKITLLENILKTREPSAVVTMFYGEKQDQHPGTCVVINSNEYFSVVFPDLNFEKLRELAARSLREQCSLNFKLPDRNGKELNTLVEFIPPPVSLVIAGAGNDAVPLIRIADTLGWDSQIVDGRHTHLSSGRFPPACQIRLAKPEQVLETIQPDSWTAFVLVTHNYQYDKDLLKYLLPLNVPYIGILGPKKKMERMLWELREEGTEITEEMLMKVFGPTGLEIGAEHPSEIALSVMAEIQAVINRKAGGFLRNKTDVIHS